MSFKQYITSSYGAAIHKTTKKLKDVKIKLAKTKNQWIFLQRCIAHKVIPKSLRIKCPSKTNYAKQLTNRYHFDLLIVTKNEAKKRFFKNLESSKLLYKELDRILSKSDMKTVENITNNARELAFVNYKNKLKEKFEKLKHISTNNASLRPTRNTLKNVTLNLCDSEIPEHHKEVLELGPKFVPTFNKIPYLDIISTTEATALKLKYDKKEITSEKLRQDVLRTIKMTKQHKSNLKPLQWKAINEMKNDDNIKIYPFDKGSGFVRISKQNALDKIKEQISHTKIIDEDPTSKITRKVQNTLRELKKNGKFTSTEYKKLYPSDALPPRMYGAIKAHKPEKDYPMRIVVSTIGTPTYRISEYLVSIIQPTLNKNTSRLKNSRSFVEKAKTWNISTNEVQVS